MAISESQLITWSNQGSVTQSSNTYNSIKGVLESSNAPYASKSFTTFLQGSYGNDTNIYAESDVDIVIQLDECFKYDLQYLPVEQQSIFKKIYTGGVAYGISNFKKDVFSHLKTTYGNSVSMGDKSIKIAANNGRRKADVIVSMDYRKYHKFLGSADQQFTDGMCFYNSSDALIVNYPKKHLANCVSKNKRTNGWFKPTVRVFKNLRNKLIQEGAIAPGDAPSYFLEGMLYNVPDSNYGVSYENTVVNALNWLNKADQSQLVCANEQYCLLNNTPAVTWRADKFTAFLNAACSLWRQW